MFVDWTIDLMRREEKALISDNSSKGQTPDREAFFVSFAESKANFPYLIYSDRGVPSENSSRRDFITIVYNYEWPLERGFPIPYRDIGNNSVANKIVGAFYRTIDFLERHIGERVRIFDIRTGCVRVRYTYGDNVDRRRLENALTVLQSVSDAYGISSLSASLEGRKIRI